MRLWIEASYKAVSVILTCRQFSLLTTFEIIILMLDLGVEIINLFSIVRIFTAWGKRIYILTYSLVRENFTASFIEWLIQIYDSRKMFSVFYFVFLFCR